MSETHYDLARCQAGKPFSVNVEEGSGLIKVDGLGSLHVGADIEHIGSAQANLAWMKDHLDNCNACYGNTGTCFLFNYTRGKNTSW